MFNILSYHKLLTYNISNFTSIKYLSQQLRSSYNVHVLGSKSYHKLIINYVITYYDVTNSNLTTLLIYNDELKRKRYRINIIISQIFP